MTVPEKVNLGEVQETLLIPLYIRAKETKSENPKLHDKEAVELIEKIDYDFSKFDNAKGSYLGVVSRTIILDREVQKFINEHPDCVIVNIGCGLCTRNVRLDLKQAKWYNLDLADVIEVREKYLNKKENCFNVAKSLLDEDWPESIDSGDKEVLLLAEGVFMYFTEEEVKKFISIVKKHYKKVTLYAEIMHSFIAGRTKQHDAVSNTNATFKWGVKYAKDVENLDPGVKFITEWNFVDEMANFGGLMMRLSSKVYFFKNFCDKFGVYEITQTN
ncbi:tetracenomycin polyketide synthesis O-methyltransferase TcmP [Neocallimastix lanati (nom. inval.)]|jgi:O-methyltransferase involved in polyketide biosynthesis|nr:tetracenomycin polyketide synthesis O-methyltransferase TcmP [Neocallimastix sp. JGI-2020a]KAG4086062.1 tetracenomycin polyketide synthesis O-methyltransferase TcmP [Neocallimastix sp. JGI-2020a]